MGRRYAAPQQAYTLSALYLAKNMPRLSVPQPDKKALRMGDLCTVQCL